MDDLDLRLQPLAQRLRFGLALGLFGGFAFALLATLLIGLGAGRSAVRIPFETLWGLYLGGGACTGLVIGALAPLARRRAGAVLVGFLALLPAAFLIGLAIRGATDTLDVLIVPSLIWASLLGGIGGFRLWEPIKPPRRGKSPFADL